MDDIGEMVECSRCRKVKECFWTEDPYIAEIYPEDENEPDWWCKECLGERQDDI